MKIFNLLIVITLLVGACTSAQIKTTKSGLEFAKFDTIYKGEKIALYSLTNKSGMELTLCNYGARIISLLAPDKNGDLQDVILSFDNIADYLKYNVAFGATIGRNANRIRQGRFTLDGVDYQLDINDPDGHSLHGGPQGWMTRVFDVKMISQNSIEMSLVEEDGANGFPGRVKASVIYTLTDDNEVDMRFRATTDKPTIINMTNHAFFNLSGDVRNSILDHQLMVNASSFTPKSSDNVTNGEILSVTNTPYDFRNSVSIRERFDTTFYDMKATKGYDVNLVLDKSNRSKPNITLYSPLSGINMDIYTSQPAVLFYSGNIFQKPFVVKKGLTASAQCAMCLETQHFTNSVNFPEWASPIIRPGEVYDHFCTLKFSVK